jgi:exodeoxyribonuclease-5
MMPGSHHFPPLPDAGARQRALLDYGATLLVEAGAGSGKTALMAGRVVLMLAHGIQPRDIVAITFTEAAAAELLERIQGFVDSLRDGNVPPELELALPTGLSLDQRKAFANAAAALDEMTCTTIHGFCQQLIKPYPIEAGIDPGATIIDPAAADLAYQDLMTAWLSARFERARGDDGLGRNPADDKPRQRRRFLCRASCRRAGRGCRPYRGRRRFSQEKSHCTRSRRRAGRGHSPPSFARDTRFRRLVCRLRHCRAGDRRMCCRSHAVPGGARQRPRRSYHRARPRPPSAA